MEQDRIRQIVEAVNQRRYHEAAAMAAAEMEEAVGNDELFWMGMRQTAEAFGMIMDQRLPQAEEMLVAAMEKLRHFGYRHRNMEVTSVLAGLRRGLEEVRAVQVGHKRAFDVSLLPKLKLAARADQA